MPPIEPQQYDRVCKARFDCLEDGQREMLELLRGKGDESGLVGLIRMHDVQIADARRTLYGTPENRKDSLCGTVQRLDLNGASRRTAEQERKVFIRSIIGKLVTAAIIALAAFLLAEYRQGGPTPDRGHTAAPGPAGATHDASAREVR